MRVILGCSADYRADPGEIRGEVQAELPLLSDPQFQAIEAYGARRMKKFLGKSFLGIVRSTYLIGPDGRIAKIWEKAPSKGHAAEVLEAVKGLS